jgi:hypothetical protein
VIIALQFDSYSPLSLRSLAYNIFELAPKVIRIDSVTHSKKNFLPHPSFVITKF